MKLYKIVDDSGVDYNFLGDHRVWTGQIVKGCEPDEFGTVVVEKPFDLPGWYSARKEHFEEVTAQDLIMPVCPVCKKQMTPTKYYHYYGDRNVWVCDCFNSEEFMPILEVQEFYDSMY